MATTPRTRSYALPDAGGNPSTQSAGTTPGSFANPASERLLNRTQLELVGHEFDYPKFSGAWIEVDAPCLLDQSGQFRANLLQAMPATTTTF